MLAAVIGLYVVSDGGSTGTFHFENAARHSTSAPSTEQLLFLGFFIAFAIKAPLWPVHTWLPDAAAEAPPGGAVLLVGVLDKVGTFGMIRFCLPLFPDASQWATPVVITLAVIGILYGALLAIGQTDMKRLIAYTSVSPLRLHRAGHLRDDDAGPVRLDALHGQPRLLDRRAVPHRRLPDQPARLAADRRLRRRPAGRPAAGGHVPGRRPVQPRAAGPVHASSASSSCWSAPSRATRWLAVIATVGIVLAALYILLMYQRTMTGRAHRGRQGLPRPRRAARRWVVAPLIAIIIALGFFPKPLLDVINPAVDRDHAAGRRHRPQARPCRRGSLSEGSAE